MSSQDQPTNGQAASKRQSLEIPGQKQRRPSKAVGEQRRMSKAVPGPKKKKKQVDVEKIRADLYREWVGRRNAFDLGKKKRKQDAAGKIKLLSGRTQTAREGPTQAKLLPSRAKARSTTPGHENVSTSSKPPPSPDQQNLPSIHGQDHMEARSKQDKFADKIRRGKLLDITDTQIEAFREVFDLFDSNGGGTIDAVELDNTFKSVGINLSNDDIIEVLAQIDKDGNGEIDFVEFLQLMTNTERFLETITTSGGQKRESLLFDALTEFMKKSALQSMEEIVGYYHTKYKRFQTPHVVNHYAAGARLIGLTEKQLKEHMEHLKAINAGPNSLKSPYAQPLHIITSTTSLRGLKPLRPRKRGRIVLCIKWQQVLPGKQDSQDQGDTSKRELPHHLDLKRRGFGWVSQRMEHVEVKLPSNHLRDLNPFSHLTAEDLPNIRDCVTKATYDYNKGRRKATQQHSLQHWRALEVNLIPPGLLRDHFKQVFSNYNAVSQRTLNHTRAAKIYV